MRRARSNSDKNCTTSGGSSHRQLAKHLGTQILLGVLEIEFLGDGNAIVADDRRPPFLLDQDRLGTRTSSASWLAPRGSSHGRQNGKRTCLRGMGWFPNKEPKLRA